MQYLLTEEERRALSPKARQNADGLTDRPHRSGEEGRAHMINKAKPDLRAGAGEEAKMPETTETKTMPEMTELELRRAIAQAKGWNIETRACYDDAWGEGVETRTYAPGMEFGAVEQVWGNPDNDKPSLRTWGYTDGSHSRDYPRMPDWPGDDAAACALMREMMGAGAFNRLQASEEEPSFFVEFWTDEGFRLATEWFADFRHAICAAWLERQIGVRVIRIAGS